MMRRFLPTISATLFLATVSQADSWPEFRGPTGMGIVRGVRTGAGVSIVLAIFAGLLLIRLVRRSVEPASLHGFRRIVAGFTPELKRFPAMVQLQQALSNKAASVDRSKKEPRE